MKQSYLITTAALSLLTACSSSPSLYPEQGIGSPSLDLSGVEQGIASPVQALKLEETDRDEDEILPAQPLQTAPISNPSF